MLFNGFLERVPLKKIPKRNKMFPLVLNHCFTTVKRLLYICRDKAGMWPVRAGEGSRASRRMGTRDLLGRPTPPSVRTRRRGFCSAAAHPPLGRGGVAFRLASGTGRALVAAAGLHGRETDTNAARCWATQAEPVMIIAGDAEKSPAPPTIPPEGETRPPWSAGNRSRP